MNILVYPPGHATATGTVFCPGCHSRDCRKHAVYIRKWFHTCTGIVSSPVTVQRYRCLNRDCPRCTFSVLPPMVLRYSHFFWPCILSLRSGVGVFGNGGQRNFRISHGVLRRVMNMVPQLTSWVEGLHREVTDGCAVRELGRMVKIINRKIGHLELANRWYRYRYPLRFAECTVRHHTIYLR